MLRQWIGRIVLAVLVPLVAAGVAACDEETPTAPTPPDPVTESFTGSVIQNGAQTHSFSTAGGGTVTATLRDVAPDSAIVIGFSLGNWSTTTSTCQIVIAKDTAVNGDSLGGTMSGIGSLCVRVYDVGNIGATPTTYRVEVTHP
jgi:hypothetical protein